MSQRILIVDDEKNVLRMVGYLLEQEGYQTSVATSGMEALEKIAAQKPDLVILDVMMPDMSGFEVCERLRKQPETIRLPILMFSALSDSKSENQGFEFGADEYISKLTEPEIFKARVATLLRRTQMLYTPIKKIGKVLGFMGAKGGVGTTTVVLNLATVLATEGKEVAAVEMRSDFGAFSTQLNLDSVGPVAGMTGLLKLSPDKISEQQVDTYMIKLHSGLRILVGPQNVAEYQEIEPQQAEAIIDILASMKDFVFLDLPCHPCKANRAAIQRCNLVVLVVEAEPTSVASAEVALNLLKSWGIVRQNIRLVIVNRVSYMNPIKVSDISSQLGCEILGIIFPMSDNLIWAQRKGLPLVLSNSSSDSTSAFHDIAKKIAAGL